VFGSLPGEQRVRGDVDQCTRQKTGRCGPEAPTRAASSTKSKARAEMSTPAPKDVTRETTLEGMLHHHDIAAPRTSAPPASVPQKRA
jgi:hypothetical protein